MSPFALLFPGQGAQFVGMGKELAERPQARALFERADALLEFPLSRLCWEGPPEELTRTKNCQPALYVTSLAALAALERAVGEAFRAQAAAGLSLGEYTALAAAGVLSFEDGLRLVRLRGQVMEEAARLQPGTMASVLGLDRPALEQICAATGAEIANVNSPGQLVISGPAEAVGAASEQAKQRGAKRVVPLEVGGAFHSRLMEPAARRLAGALESVPIHRARYPVLSNVTGSYHPDDPQQLRRLLVEQMTQPVQWEACIRTLLRDGLRRFLEVGAGAVLKGLARKIEPEAVVLSVGSVADLQEVSRQWA